MAKRSSTARWLILAAGLSLSVVSSAGNGGARPGGDLTPDDNARGFLATAVEPAESVKEERQWLEAAPELRIELFGARGEHRSFAVAIKALQDVEGLSHKVSGLSGAKGGFIDAANLDISKVVSHDQKKMLGHFLAKGFPCAIPAGKTAWLWGSVSIPEDAAPGTYKGTLELSTAPDKKVTFELNLLVLDFKLEEARGNWGAYVPGHFADNQSGCKTWCSESWTKDNIGRYFKFWKTMRLNSPTLCHVYPGLRLVGGKPVADFSTLSRFAAAMRKSGLDGFMVIDPRFIQWWASAAALRYERMKAEGKDVSGDLGVGCAAGKSPDKEYSPLAVELFTEVIKQLLATAKRENWPEILIFPEEEVGNGGPVKPLGYETFAPALKKIAPEKIVLIDNDIGYGRKNAVDRGARDNIKRRQYNSWEESALRKAVADGAEVWGYNYGFTRASFGFLQQRLGSTGYHQWADQWPEWVFSMITDKGIIGSTELEQSREGRYDYDYCNTLKVYAGKLKSAGFVEEAAALGGRLAAILAEIPVSGPEFGTWRINAGTRKLDNMRWMVALEIQRARRTLGEQVMDNPAPRPGSPEFKGVTPARASMKDDAKRPVLLVPYCDRPLSLDGSLQEACWGAGDNATGALRWMASTEIAMRAYAASEEEFRKMPAPSYSSASFAYGRDGLYLGVRVNHVSPGNPPSKFSDDDGEMWKDNCMEFFFKPSFGKEGGQIYHLIVNTNGNKVMMLGTHALDSSGIKTAVKGNVESSGGSAQELLIPWKVFGLDAAPAPGTVWLANVGREYHPLRQYTSWGKVYGGFWEVEKWGALNFAGSNGEADIKPKEVCLFPGKNKMEGNVVFRSGAASRPGQLALNLKDAAGKVVGSTPLNGKPDAKELAFSLDYTIPCLRGPEEWTLALDDAAGKSLGSLKLPLSAGENTILVNRLPELIRSGERFSADALFRVGNADVVGITLNGEFVAPDGKERTSLRGTAVKAGGEGKIWVDSAGLAPGKWLFRMWLERGGAKDRAFEREIEVLPPF